VRAGNARGLDQEPAGVGAADFADAQTLREDVRIVVELRGGDPVCELSQTAVVATSGAAVEGVV
jgi:hypothetical protein